MGLLSHIVQSQIPSDPDEAFMKTQGFVLPLLLRTFVIVASICCGTAYAQGRGETVWPTKEWQRPRPKNRAWIRRLCVPKTLNPTIVVMKSAQDGA
jgi:hypothetical protein